MSDGPKKFKDLRVADLKVELEKRGMPTSGIKAVLAERLKNALADEGIDVEEFVFDKPAGKDSDNRGASDEEQAGPGEGQAEDKKEGNEKEQPGADKNSEEHSAAAADKADSDAAEMSQTGEREEENSGKEAEEKEAEEKEAEEKEAEEKEVEEKEAEEKEAEDDSLNIMVGDEDNLFGEEEKTNGTPASPPRPENVPAKHPFTSRDTISLSSRGNRPPSENSSMRVNPDETQSVASHDSNDVVRETDEAAAELAKEPSAKEAAAKEDEETSKNEGDKAKAARAVAATARNLWVSGLSETTKARDLKELFSKYGKVEGAKVVTNAKHAGARCYGFITMEKPEDAARCIENLNKRELHGNMILVESATADSGPSRPSAASRLGDKPRAEGSTPSERRKSVSKDSGSARKDDHHRHRGSSSGRGVSSSRGQSSTGRAHSSSRSASDARRISGSRTQGASAAPRRDEKAPAAGGVLTFHQIKDQRKKELEREEERRRRERERRREEEEERRRKEALRRQREEEERLRREREELRKEREKLEREKQELMKFERERQRLEREKLEREKQELERLRRQQMSSRIVEDRRPNKRMAEERDPYFEDRKRPPQREDYPAAGSSRGVYEGAARRPDDWSSSAVGGRYDGGRSGRDVIASSGRGPPPPVSSRDVGSSRGMGGSSRSMGSARESGSSGHTSSRDLSGSSYKGSSREMLGSSGHMGGSGYLGGSRDGASSRDIMGGGHSSHSSRSVSGGRDMGSSRDLGRPSGSDYGRNRDERGSGRSMHGSGVVSHDVAAHGSRSNTIGSHASGSGWNSSMGSSGLAADWGRSGGIGGDRGGGGASGLPARAMSGMSNLSAMAMGVGVGVNPFSAAISSNPFAGGSMASGSLGGSGAGADRYDAYTLKNPLLGTRRY